MRHHISTDEFQIAVGTDHVFGYFAQVWESEAHAASCDCETCLFDKPLYEGDRLDGWRGVIAFVRDATGLDITPQIVGV